MTDCNKYKKKAYIGFFLFFYFLIGRVIDFSEYIGLQMDLILAFIFMILGLYLVTPYMDCLNDYNDRHKPPFEK